jgi:hypothetical protein
MNIIFTIYFLSIVYIHIISIYFDGDSHFYGEPHDRFYSCLRSPKKPCNCIVTELLD